MRVKKLLTILAMMLLAITADAQINYHPIVHLPNDLDAKVNYSVPDRSSGRAGDLCAIIKIVHSDMNFTFDIGSLVVNKTVPHPELGELWVYVPVGTNRIKIAHPKYGSLDTQDGFYWFEGGLKCQSGQVYKIRLETQFMAEDEDIVTDDTQQRLVVFNVSPSKAIVRLRKLSFSTDEIGRLEQKLPLGSFNYQVAADGYYDHVGKVEIQAGIGEQTVNVVLQHRQGMLDVKTKQAGATIKVDGKYMGITPLAAPLELHTGTHALEVSCPDYQTDTRTITINEEQILSVSVELMHATMFSINSSPTGSILYIDGKEKGITPCTIESPSGDYTLRLTHDKYRDFVKRVHLDSSQPVNSFKLHRQFVRKNSGYTQLGIQIGSMMAYGATIGGYIENVNVEASFFMGFDKSENVYWNSDKSPIPLVCSYTPIVYDMKTGYGLIVGSRIRVTPQIGAALVSVYGNTDEGSSKCYLLAGSLGGRIEYAIMQGVGLFVAPEASLALSKSPIYKQVSKVSSKIAGWSKGFNVRAGATFFF